MWTVPNARRALPVGRQREELVVSTLDGRILTNDSAVQLPLAPPQSRHDLKPVRGPHRISVLSICLLDLIGQRYIEYVQEPIGTNASKQEPGEILEALF